MARQFTPINDPKPTIQENLPEDAEAGAPGDEEVMDPASEDPEGGEDNRATLPEDTQNGRVRSGNSDGASEGDQESLPQVMEGDQDSDGIKPAPLEPRDSISDSVSVQYEADDEKSAGAYSHSNPSSTNGDSLPRLRPRKTKPQDPRALAIELVATLEELPPEAPQSEESMAPRPRLRSSARLAKKRARDYEVPGDKPKKPKRGGGGRGGGNKSAS